MNTRDQVVFATYEYYKLFVFYSKACFACNLFVKTLMLAFFLVNTDMKWWYICKLPAPSMKLNPLYVYIQYSIYIYSCIHTYIHTYIHSNIHKYKYIHYQESWHPIKLNQIHKNVMDWALLCISVGAQLKQLPSERLWWYSRWTLFTILKPMAPMIPIVYVTGLICIQSWFTIAYRFNWLCYGPHQQIWNPGFTISSNRSIVGHASGWY